jgi:hypothetical protein
MGENRLGEVVQYRWICTPIFQPREEFFLEFVTYGFSTWKLNPLDIAAFTPSLVLSLSGRGGGIRTAVLWRCAELSRKTSFP